MRVDVIETIGDPHQLVRRNIDDVVNVDEMPLEGADDQRNQNLLAQLAKLFGSHMLPVCALVALIPMPGNIAHGDIRVCLYGDISGHMRSQMPARKCRDELDGRFVLRAHQP